MAKKNTQPDVRFEQRLVLNQWLIGLFGVATFEHLAEWLRDPALEGLDDNGVTLFHSELARRLPHGSPLSPDLLLVYDNNIVRHWNAISAPRSRAGNTVQMKYFQYLALLWSEIYLDRFFSNRQALCDALNQRVLDFNQRQPNARLERYTVDGLNKLAFWNATGSGKTLLMHVNIAQYRHYVQQHGRGHELNRIVLLTPNEGLSAQHLAEFGASGMLAGMFNKAGRTLWMGNAVEIIDIHKLKETSGDKTVAIDAFEHNNLVLVDEGHRGSSGTEWKDKRDRLSSAGFSFEYSATFGQAIKAANKPSLTDEYARCIAFDYSYKYFYRDGYGKDYHILNLDDDRNAAVRLRYLTACVLKFYEQVRLFQEHGHEHRPFLLEHPLLVFVGSSVTKGTNSKELSDIEDILLFLARFIGDESSTIAAIQDVLHGNAGLLDRNGHEIFANSFSELRSRNESAATIFQDVLARVFHAPSNGALHLDELQGSNGELALRIGNGADFGVINVGDARALRRLAEKHRELVVGERAFAGSLFERINDSRVPNPITLLIGAKKFTEGWSSWRVSTMGLMNVGKGEGSEIIQLFGRGVRLKGHEFSLKRSNHLPAVSAPPFLPTLETLNIFGVRADYMRQFNEYLADEGLPNGRQTVEIVLPTISQPWSHPLKTIRVKPHVDFKRDGAAPTLGLPTATHDLQIKLDWYPKIQSARSGGLAANSDVVAKHATTLAAQHCAFLDLDALYFALQRSKNERSMHNFNLSRAAIANLLAHPTWYTVLIPASELQFTSFEQVRVWQEIAQTLLIKYTDTYYRYAKAAFEQPYLEYTLLQPSDPNFISEYRLLVEQSASAIITTLEQIKAELTAGTLVDHAFNSKYYVLTFDRHLYQPLLAFEKSTVVEMKPTALNEGERRFIADLRAFHQAESQGFFANRSLYVLRNQSRKGIGFFEAGNFYPDFIVWLVDATSNQVISFIDPKGIRNLKGLDDPKITFQRTIKDLEQRMADPMVTLEAFIIANTPHSDVRHWRDEHGQPLDRAAFAQQHVLFQGDDPTTYIQTMLTKIASRLP